MEAAICTEHRTQYIAITIDKPNQCLPHRFTTLFQCWARLLWSSSFVALRAPERVLTTISTRGSPAQCSLKESRMIRLIRFLFTAFPTLRADTDNPSDADGLSADLARTRK